MSARLHLHAWTGVPDADVLGVWSPSSAHAAETAALARRLNVGAAKPFPSITAMVADPAIDALWLCGSTVSRVENVEEIADAVIRAKGSLAGLACEKPLARNVAEAQRVTELAAHAGVKHGYLENQAFAPRVTEGKPGLWCGDLQEGGGSYDMLCQSTLIVRFLLAPPGAALAALRPKRVTGRIADHTASVTIEFRTPDGRAVLGEAAASWSLVGAGWRSPAEYLRREYSLSWSTLDSGVTGVFLNCEVKGAAGPDPVEEAAAYGYEALDRHFVQAFLGLEEPLLTFEDGLDVVRLLMTAYKSADEGRTLDYPPVGLETFAPAVT